MIVFNAMLSIAILVMQIIILVRSWRYWQAVEVNTAAIDMLDAEMLNLRERVRVLETA